MWRIDCGEPVALNVHLWAHVSCCSLGGSVDFIHVCPLVPSLGPGMGSVCLASGHPLPQSYCSSTHTTTCSRAPLVRSRKEPAGAQRLFRRDTRLWAVLWFGVLEHRVVTLSCEHIWRKLKVRWYRPRARLCAFSPWGCWGWGPERRLWIHWRPWIRAALSLWAGKELGC